jgi:hypothetical protein
VQKGGFAFLREKAVRFDKKRNARNHFWEDKALTLLELGQLTDAPETHRLIVGNYAGNYTLGVTDNPPGFVLRVQSRDTDRFPKSVSLKGQVIPVTVAGGFDPVVPISKQGISPES